nr:ADP-ribosylglycohydrolase family protein [Clostridiales bacterium]
KGWESYSSSLEIELRQSIQEGLNIDEYEDFIKAVSKMPRGANKEKAANVVWDIISGAGINCRYGYIEPSDLDGIKELRDPELVQKYKYDPKTGYDKVKGAWYGRIAGCMLGKTVEGMKRNELIPFLQNSGNYPMHRYILSTDVNEEIASKYKFNLLNRCYADKLEFEPVDDDTNYTVLYQGVIDKYGFDFTPKDVAYAWVAKQPKEAYCTAERVAFMNIVRGIKPPFSGSYRNVFREWIGAQIRADYFGYINPGNPEKAAEMAWRDACVSHTKNGIYGEMFVAAALAAAAATKDIKKIVNAGLSQIPKTSRMYEAIAATLYAYENGVSEEEFFEKFNEQFDDQDAHDWCLAISNVIIVVASLLYSKGDYSKAICMAVQTGFDTDCNGATVGSILGMRNGFESIDSYWTKPMHGTLDTSIFGVGRVSIDSLVDKTMVHIENNK